jgi:LysR family transcriptional regulator, nitrogen assimilation regulatory protein
MDVGQLRTLVHVAELGSLSKASDRLHIAQPALSRQIRLLEEELGARLFDRHGRGMVITDIGREVLAHALRVLGEMEQIRASVADLNASLQGTVAIGMPPTVAEIITAPLARLFRDKHPQVVPRFVPAFTGYLLDWLQRGEVDVAVLYDPQPSRTLKIKPLLLENLFLIGPAEADLVQIRAVPFQKLAGEKMLLPSARHGLRAIVDRCAEEAGISFCVALEADSLSTLKDLVKTGFGLTILPLAPIHEDIAAGRLKAAPLVDPTPTRRLILAYPGDRPISRLTRFAGESIGTVVGDLVSSGVWAGHLLSDKA